MSDPLKRIEGNCKTLSSGWNEQIDYTVAVKYHVDGCKARLMGAACPCPTRDEKRSRYVKRDGLLDQLKNYQANKDVDRNPKAARGAPRVKKVKFMPELNGFFCLDEITTEAYMLLDRVYFEGGRDRTIAAGPLSAVFIGLGYQMHMIAEAGRDDLVAEVATATDRWVLAARRTLNLTVSQAQFANTVCGCGGGLSVNWDNTGEVRCIGTPAEPPCGSAYGPSDWIALYDQGRQR